MGNPEQFSEEYRLGFRDALEAAGIIMVQCGDIGGTTQFVTREAVSRIEEVTPELYAGWRELEKAESRNPTLVEVPDGGE